jgi:hypothetical protein
MLTRITGVNRMVDPRRRWGSTSLLWGFKSEEGLAPNAYTHALFADFDLAGQK